MYFITALILYGILQAAAPALAGCAADNCLRGLYSPSGGYQFEPMLKVLIR